MASNATDAGRGGRIVLALSIFMGLSYLGTTATGGMEQFGLASDVYATAVDSWLGGDDLYRVAPDDRPGFFFLYPPASVPLFVPHALLGAGLGAYLFQTLLNILVLGATVVALVRALGRRGIELGRIDLVLMAGFVALSPYAMPHLIEGQTTLWLALALVIGFDALDQRRELLAGGAFAVAALIKVFPAAVGLWLLRLRATRGVAVAIATGMGALVIGLVFGVELTEQYLTEILLDRHGNQIERVTQLGPDTGGAHRQLTAITGVTGTALTVLTAAVLLPLLGLAYRRVDTDVHRLTAVLATVAALLLFMPLQPLYNALLYFPVVVLVFALAAGPARWLLHLGILWTLVMVSHDNYVEWLEVLPTGLADVLIPMADAFYTFAIPPDIGLWCFLAAAILVHTDWYTERYPIARPGLDDPRASE